MSDERRTPDEPAVTPAQQRVARWAGIALQALILGSLLFVAIGQLVALGTGSRLFRYQAF
jgi:hypothetical protein